MDNKFSQAFVKLLNRMNDSINSSNKANKRCSKNEDEITELQAQVVEIIFERELEID